MTASVYIIGGAGTGKSTFTAQLLDQLALPLGPLEDLHAKANKKNVVTLRGHSVGDDGLYIGCMRESFPGTDGLDRATSPTAAEWLELEMHSGLRFIVGEGATLATRRFLAALHEHTRLLLVHLWADDFVKELRFAERGSNQAEQFVKQTATRSANLLSDMEKAGVLCHSVDTADPDAWVHALWMSKAHLRG